MSEQNQGSRRRRTTALVVSGAAAATVLVLGVTGTLSSWTVAIITNDTNTAQAATAVALTESGPNGSGGTATCTTLQSTDNTATCSTINKYGGSTAMSPGDTSTVDVTFTNSGNASAGTFKYAPGTCTSTPGPGSVDLCTDGDLTVAVACSTGTTYNVANAIPALAQAAVTPGTLASMTLAGTPALAAGGTITCEFTTTLSSTAPAEDASSAISQPIVWTLSA